MPQSIARDVSAQKLANEKLLEAARKANAGIFCFALSALTSKLSLAPGVQIDPNSLHGAALTLQMHVDLLEVTIVPTQEEKGANHVFCYFCW